MTKKLIIAILLSLLLASSILATAVSKEDIGSGYRAPATPVVPHQGRSIAAPVAYPYPEPALWAELRRPEPGVTPSFACDPAPCP